MCFYKVFRNGQSQTATLNFSSRYTEITIKNALVISWIDSFAKVLHIELDILFFMPYANHYSAILFRIANRIA